MAKQVLLVTGSSGIAAATARLWAATDPVFVVGIDAEQCRSLSSEFREAGFAVAEVRDETAVTNAISACLDRFGRIDAVFNGAGVSARRFGDGPLHECKTEAWDTAMDVNARGTFFICRQVLDTWRRAEHAGAIVNIGSVLARHPQRDHFATLAYAASKGAIEAMSVSAAAYYAAYGIRINVIAAGLVRTPMSARAQANSQIMDYVSHKQPLTKGMLSPEDIARTARFLLSSESSPITGQVINVDGGWTVSE